MSEAATPTLPASTVVLNLLAAQGQKDLGKRLDEEILNLRRALEEIVVIPGERTLLLNAEARAMYEIARLTLEQNR